jgi:hypothetical protein
MPEPGKQTARGSAKCRPGGDNRGERPEDPASTPLYQHVDKIQNQERGRQPAERFKVREYPERSGRPEIPLQKIHESPERKTAGKKAVGPVGLAPRVKRKHDRRKKNIY